MNDIQETFKLIAGHALMESMIKVSLNPYFLKMLAPNEFEALIKLVNEEARSRELKTLLTEHSQAPQTPEEQCAALRTQFGEDGMKAVEPVLTGYVEPILPDWPSNGLQGVGQVVLDESIPKFAEYNFPLRHTAANVWEIDLNNPRVREAANLLTRDHFQTAGAISSYDVTDQILYFIHSLDSNEFVHIRNITQGKNFCLGTPLHQFNKWFKTTSAKLAEQ